MPVADNGDGIPAKYHNHLLEQFAKARRQGLKGEPSVGLGMSIIKTMVSGMVAKYGLKVQKIKVLPFILNYRKSDLDVV